MATVVVPAAPVHPDTLAVTLYVPAAAAVTEEIVGVCEVAVNPLGPVQEYVAPPMAPAAKLSVPPTQTGVLEEAVGAAGSELITTVVVVVVLVQLPTVTLTL